MKKFMKVALQSAQKAYENNEVPIGAVVVWNNKIIGTGHNRREQENDISAHAEIIAIKQAAKYLNTWKLEDCVIYVTIKPCLMCYSAIEQSRIKTVYYGADQQQFKKSAFDTRIESKVDLVGPILEIECQDIMTKFFERIRNES